MVSEDTDSNLAAGSCVYHDGHCDIPNLTSGSLVGYNIQQLTTKSITLTDNEIPTGYTLTFD